MYLKSRKSVYLDVNKGNKLRSLPEVIVNSMGIKDVEWFGKGYVPMRFSYEQKERFRQRMHEALQRLSSMIQFLVRVLTLFLRKEPIYTRFI